MIVVISGIQIKFPKVVNVNTETLDAWMKYKAKSSEHSVGNDELSSVDNRPNIVDPGQLIILDSREDEEIMISKIPGSVPISPESTGQQCLNKVIQEANNSTENKVTAVFYCSVGYRASKLAQELMNQLDKMDKSTISKSIDVYNLAGGIFKWANEGRFLVDGENRKTSYVHPYNVVWGKLLNSELRKWPS